MNFKFIAIDYYPLLGQKKFLLYSPGQHSIIRDPFLFGCMGMGMFIVVMLMSLWLLMRIWLM